jgi:hypothetical protein
MLTTILDQEFVFGWGKVLSNQKLNKAQAVLVDHSLRPLLEELQR